MGVRFYLGLALLSLVLSACGRPLTVNEAAFLGGVQNTHLDYRPVRVVKGLGLGIERARAAGELAQPVDTGAEGGLTDPAALEAVIRGRAEALVLGNRIFYAAASYQDDFLPRWPGEIDISDAALLAHEITHVWQAQNRAVTGYSLAKALGEHLRHDDPYAYDLEPGKGFLEYRFEQQGRIVQDYVMLLYSNPHDPKFPALEGLVREVFPTGELLRALDVLCARRGLAGCS